MRWIKKGLIFSSKNQPVWSKNSALTPSPILLGDKIRVYAGFRDDEGVSRIGFVDLNADCPNEIIGVSDKPVLDIGEPGTFDDNGVILGDVIADGDQIRMYYVGFQLVKRAKFLAFSGLAISNDNGNTFERVSNAPILDRSNNQHFIRAIHTALNDNGTWKIWYAAGNKWEIINGQPFPCYNIYYTESKNGIDFNNPAQFCVDNIWPEYRIGRPRVYKISDNKYLLFYTKGTIHGDYFPGVATSTDGINWVRKDDQLGIELSNEGWDSETLCYPSLLNYKNKVYMFYNGNKMGADGFGYAELDGDLWI
ncbi:hypothetical protein [Pinibacter soli]|uniref:Glycosyl hydrolase family 32 N-terminal domain-containing protein n=1 Tax=Pinibacter soli TaxID=3044211 RepID=A0ABT6R7V1_9BACT|nr:hypothetical protein [Pinibacter soli]MDI3318639.1 hypothetical protein [Pinibacter soli]